jgi:hypothetical protein
MENEEGIDLSQFPISFDSWYCGNDLVESLKESGFEQIVGHGKNNFVFTIGKESKKLVLHKEEVDLLENQWGCGKKKVARKVGKSSTFGKTVILFYEDGNRRKCLLAFGRALRACEIISIWRQHHGVEEFWRVLKHDCGLKKMRPLKAKGTYLACATKVLAYIMMKQIAGLFKITIHQLKIQVRRKIDLLEFFVEHFHMLKPRKDQILYG